jgi:hypothetical protein
MTRTTQPETSPPQGTPDAHTAPQAGAVEADAQDSIAKALRLFENGERTVAEHMFERLRQRVLQAGPVAMLISGSESADERAELQTLVNAVADIANAKPERDEG